jgi:hypothetical protein
MSFEQGDNLEAINFKSGEFIRVGKNCDSIIVSMENGQMAPVPWFEVWKEGKLVSKWNAAQTEGVQYKKQNSRGEP